MDADQPHATRSKNAQTDTWGHNDTAPSPHNFDIVLSCTSSSFANEGPLVVGSAGSAGSADFVDSESVATAHLNNTFAVVKPTADCCLYVGEISVAAVAVAVVVIVVVAAVVFLVDSL